MGGGVFAFLLFALASTACDVFDGDDEPVPVAFEGRITVGLTDEVLPGEGGDSGTYTLRNVFSPDVPEILAIVQLEGAAEGTVVRGEWYQLGTLQLDAAAGAEGALVSEAAFTIDAAAIDPATGAGGGRLRLVPSQPLPPDSYLLRVYVDGALARTVGFVVQ